MQRATVGYLVELCRRKGLKVNGDKYKVMVLNIEQGLECEVWTGCNLRMCPNLNTLGMFWMNQVRMKQCCRKVASRKRIAGVIRSLVNARGLQLDSAKSSMRLCSSLFLCMVVRH